MNNFLQVMVMVAVMAMVMLTQTASAGCSQKNFAGAYVFSDLGKASGISNPYYSVGRLIFDKAGNIIGGHVKRSQNVLPVGYNMGLGNGNLTVQADCQATLILKLANDVVLTYKGSSIGGPSTLKFIGVNSGYYPTASLQRAPNKCTKLSGSYQAVHRVGDFSSSSIRLQCNPAEQKCGGFYIGHPSPSVPTQLTYEGYSLTTDCFIQFGVWFGYVHNAGFKVILKDFISLPYTMEFFRV